MSTEKEKIPTPFSLRLTFEERAILNRKAGNLPLGQYIRETMLSDAAKPRKMRTKLPVQDQKALAKVLAALGKSRVSNNLNQIAKAIHLGTYYADHETSADIREACAHIRQMHDALMLALGLNTPERGS